MHINGINEKDNEIINLLLKDARMSYSDIGEKIGLSRTAVKNRVATLEKNGIIEGYRAVINPQESSEMMTFIVNIETNPEHFDSKGRKIGEGRYTPTKVKGKRESHNIYAKTREECEEKLAEMIAEVKAQIKAEKDKMTG